MENPSKRSGRLQLKGLEAQSNRDDSAEWPKGINTIGLPTLPDELLLEIISYYPPLPLPRLSESPVDTVKVVARRDTLLALSRSCSNLRRFFRPYIWERIEVCTGMPIGNSFLNHARGKEGAKEFATELVRQLEIVTIRDPTLAEYVRIINVDVTDYSVHNVLVELGRCMALFANLHTVKLWASTSTATIPMAMTRGFKKHTYSQIRAVVLTESSLPLLLSCPNIRSVETALPLPFIKPYLEKCPLVERLPFYLGPDDIPDLVSVVPNVRDVTLLVHYHTAEDMANFDKLLPLQNLQTLTLVATHSSGSVYDETRQQAQRILLLHQKRDCLEKRLVLQEYTNGLPEAPRVIILPAP